MLRKLAIAFVLLVFASIAVAQNGSASGEAPSKEGVIKFLEVTQARSRILQMFDGMARQARLGADQAFREKVPDATPEQIARVEQIAESLFKEFSPDEMIDALVPIYQKHFSKADLDAMLVFYASPAGQKVLKEMPAILAESMEVGGEMGRRKTAAINQKIEQQIAEMIREEQNRREK